MNKLAMILSTGLIASCTAAPVQQSMVSNFDREMCVHHMTIASDAARIIKIGGSERDLRRELAVVDMPKSLRMKLEITLKYAAYMARKGYSYSEIRRVIYKSCIESVQ